MRRIVDERLLRARGVVAFYPANSVGDDVLVFEADEDDDDEDEALARLCCLRQQAEKESKDEPYVCLSDFVVSFSLFFFR